MWNTAPEEWRRLKNFAGYKISSYGNLVDEQGIGVETFFGPTDELFVSIQRHEWSFNGPLWILMLRSWYDGNLDGIEFEYLGGDISNLSLDNLYPIWMHPTKGWTRCRWHIDRFGDRVIDRRLRGRRVEVVETGQIFDSVDELAQSIDGDKSNVYSVLRGRLKTHKGYSFRYVE